MGLKDNALKTLKQQGLIVPALDRVMTEDVEPWLVERMMGFLVDEDFQEKNVSDMVEDGIVAPTHRHREAIEKEYQRRKDAIEAEK